MGFSVSPLRYPGGKYKYWRLFKEIIQQNNLNINLLIEPFCGGAGLGLGLIKHGIIKQAILNEKDHFIYNFWKILFDRSDELIELIKNEPITVERFIYWREIYKDQEFVNSLNSVQLAYAFFFINRVTRSGIYNAGVIGGWEQKGNYPIDARFKLDYIIEKFNLIISFRDNISVYNYDYNDFFSEMVKNNDNFPEDSSIIYFDPPYYKIGKTLYNKYFFDQDHLHLRDLLNNYQTSNWILSYNKCKEILDIFGNFNIYNATFRNTANNRQKKEELVILSNNLKIRDNEYGFVKIKKL